VNRKPGRRREQVTFFNEPIDGRFLSEVEDGRLLLSKLAAHRGMLHCILAMLIAAEVGFRTFHSDSNTVRFLMAVGITPGFLLHLYS